MIVWAKNEVIEITSDIEPVIENRVIFPFSTDAEIDSVHKRPYMNCENVWFRVKYEGNGYNLFVPKGYTWDGSSCPFLHNVPTLLLASMVHDKITEAPWLVDYNRRLSSLIFKELGIVGGMNKNFMNIAFYCVDWYQKLFCKKNWRRHGKIFNER